MVGREHRLAADAPISVYANRSNWVPDTEHIMGLDVTNDGLRNILRPEVKTFVGAGLRNVINPLLDEFELSPGDIHEWTLHPGGPRIMDAAEVAFSLSAEKMQASRDTLRQVGNISSATVLHMIDDTLKHRRPPAGRNGMMVAMGPGFSQEAVLVRWN
jgi:alkylresorcinol/alkylpyrone synthase